MKGFLEEFKAFALRGNVLDLAVGVVIGGAFGKIVTSLVENIITPIIGIITGGQNISGLMVKVGGAELKYGAFLQSVIDFIIIAFAIFVFIKAINKVTSQFKKEQVEEAVEEPVNPTDELLKEIRDILARK